MTFCGHLGLACPVCSSIQIGWKMGQGWGSLYLRLYNERGAAINNNQRRLLHQIPAVSDDVKSASRRSRD